jgi:hypothetical protein
VAAGAVTRSSGSVQWALVEPRPPTGERLTVAEALAGRRPDLLIGVDGALRRYVLVGIPQGEPAELQERTSKGIAVRTVEMNVGGGRLQCFVEIACLEDSGKASLDIVVTELADALYAGASIGRVRLVQNVLAKWRRFWSGADQGLLTRGELIGLFGELWFLVHWLVPSVGISRAATMWRGPSRARSDFEGPGLAIEVKTTSKPSSIQTINGLEQLMEPRGGSLFLFSLCIREEASAADHLPRLADQARSLAVSDEEALSRIETALVAAGYEDRYSVEYSKSRFRVRRQELFRVMEDFPRLVPDSLRHGVPPGVDGVTYEWSPDAAQAWLVASTPAAAATLLADFSR